MQFILSGEYLFFLFQEPQHFIFDGVETHLQTFLWCSSFLHDDTLHQLEGLHASWTFPVLQQQQNLGQRFGTSKMHLSPPVALAAVRSKVVVLLLLTFCLLSLPLLESVIVLCFVVRYFMSILILQSSWWGGESWLLCLIRLPGVSWWLSGSSLWCHGVVCSLWLWYFLIILTILERYF